MTALNTIIEEEKEKARKQFDDSPVSLRIDALESYAHVHGWSQFEGRTIQDEIDTIVTTAIQRAYEAGREEGFREGQKDAERADWLRSEIEKLEGVKTNYVQGMENGLLHHREPCQCQTCVDKRNDTLTSIITRYKEELLELDKEVE